MTARHVSTYLRTASKACLALGLLAGTLTLGACATDSGVAAAKPDPVLPTTQYPLTAESTTKSINLRVNANGLSDNQKRALDLVAAKASWVNGQPITLQIVTSGEPNAVSAGHDIGGYLVNHDVNSGDIVQVSEQEQPADIITINMVSFHAVIHDCHQSWENLAATGSNKQTENFGCAVTSNLAAQIADPRDLDHPTAATSPDTGRRSTILDKYRKGENTSSQKDDQATGAISDAIK